MRATLLLVLVLSTPGWSDPPPRAGCAVAADCQLIQGSVPSCQKRAAASPVLANDTSTCRCDFPTGLCVFAWEGPVACSTDADCAWGRDEQHEVALPVHFLPHPSKKPKRSRACADHISTSCSPQARICVLHVPGC